MYICTYTNTHILFHKKVNFIKEISNLMLFLSISRYAFFVEEKSLNIIYTYVYTHNKHVLMTQCWVEFLALFKKIYWIKKFTNWIWRQIIFTKWYMQEVRQYWKRQFRNVFFNFLKILSDWLIVIQFQFFDYISNIIWTWEHIKYISNIYDN